MEEVRHLLEVPNLLNFDPNALPCLPLMIGTQQLCYLAKISPTFSNHGMVAPAYSLKTILYVKIEFL